MNNPAIKNISNHDNSHKKEEDAYYRDLAHEMEFVSDLPESYFTQI